MNIDPKKVKTTGFDDAKFVLAFCKSKRKSPSALLSEIKGTNASEGAGVDDDKQERNNPEYFRNKLCLLKNSSIVEVKDLLQKLSNHLRYCSVELVIFMLAPLMDLLNPKWTSNIPDPSKNLVLQL